MITPDNTLFYGDCLRVLTDDIAPASVDLIYLDPPFNSKRDYNIPLGGKAQANVFADTWVWSATQDEAIDYIAERDPSLYQQLNWLLQFASGGNIAASGGLAAYLAYMAARLLACKRVLKDTGSIYLHCDPTASHYLKLLMDGVFGTRQFRNEIVWCYRGMPSIAKRWQQKHDTILFYAKTKDYHFEVLRGQPTEGSQRTFASARNRGYNLNRSKKMVTVFDWEKYQQAIDAGVIPNDLQPKEFTGGEPPMMDWWEDIRILGGPKNKERLGYPTQKPLALLERIIRASSNEGDLVLDPFCGCGTAVEAAQRLGRRWLGIDVEPLAVDLMARRLRDRCGVDPQIRGIPYDFEQAQRLAANAPYEFERWAIRLIPGAQPNFKQSGDGGLDGRAVIASAKRPQPLFGFQVKGGQTVGRPVLDAFHGALTMNGCTAGLLVVLEERIAHRLRGHLGAQERVQLNGWSGPRIGVWSVEDWLEGRRGAPVPPLVGAGETLELLRPQAWQRRLDAGVN